MKIRKWHVFSAFGLLGLIAVLVVCAYTVRAILLFTAPTNARDNESPAKRLEMVQVTREWGQLAPFPPTAQAFTIYTEGNPFTRTFRGSFVDSPETVAHWLRNSRGVSEGSSEVQSDGSTKYILKMGGGASYGEIVVSPDGSDVRFRVSWS